MSTRKRAARTPGKTPGKTPSKTPKKTPKTTKSQGDEPSADMVLITREELEELRAIKEAWEKSEPIVFRQQEMLAALDAKTRIAVSAREDENKHLKSQVAHYKAASQAELVTQQRDILALLEALTNTTICEEGERFLCISKTLDLEPCMSFYLRVDEAGSVHYDPIKLAPGAPGFFGESIVFSRGQAVIFFREVLKLLSAQKK